VGEEESKNSSRLEQDKHSSLEVSRNVESRKRTGNLKYSSVEHFESNSLVLNQAVARLGQSMRETEDQLIRDMLAGTASVVNCVNGVNGDNPTEITRVDIDGVTAALQGNDGDFIANVVEGQDKFGTGPVRDSYFCMSDTGMIGQLENCAGFLNKAQYPSQSNISPSEWGNVGNVRFFLSSRGSITTAGSLLGNNIYNNFIVAQDAYAKIEQNGVSAKFIYHGPGHGDDPVELRQTAAWRMAQVPRIKDVVLVKSSLIDLETYVMLEAA